MASTTNLNDRYTDRLPSPPRIHVPIVHHAAKRIVPNFAARPDGLFDGFTMSLSDLRREWGDWDYEQRRLPQQILPFLYLGPTASAKDPDLLRSRAISLLVIVRYARPGQFAARPMAARVADQLPIACEVLDVWDNQTLSGCYSSAIERINAHLAAFKAANGGTLGRVLLVDESGNERAAALATAYIMATTDLDLVLAAQLVQTQRFCVNLDDGLKHTLVAFQDILAARRDVGQMAASAVPPIRQSLLCNLPPASAVADPASRRTSTKRGFDAGSDDEEDVVMRGTEEAPPRRRGFTPFADG